MKSIILNKHIILALAIGIVVIINIFIPGYTNGFSIDPSIDLKELIQNNNFEEIFYQRTNDPVFKKRIVFTCLQNSLKDIFNIPLQLSFNLVNFVLLFLCIKLLKLNYLILYKFNENGILYTHLTFLLSMPIVFAFGGYISTYDDFLQYFLVLLLFNQYLKSRIFISCCIFFLALITRETSMIFAYPILVWNKNIEIKFRIIISIIPIIFFLLFIYYINNSSESIEFLLNKRFYAWKSNFANFKFVFESIITYVIVLLFPLIILYNQGRNLITHKFGLLLIMFNTVIVSLTGIVHESRLIFLPLLILFPIIGYLIVSNLKINLKKLNKIQIIVLILLCILIFMLYEPSIGKSAIIYKLYSIFLIILLYICVCCKENYEQVEFNHFNGFIKNEEKEGPTKV